MFFLYRRRTAKAKGPAAQVTLWLKFTKDHTTAMYSLLAGIEHKTYAVKVVESLRHYINELEAHLKALSAYENKMPKEFPKDTEPPMDDFIEEIVIKILDLLNKDVVKDVLTTADSMNGGKKRKNIAEPKAPTRTAPPVPVDEPQEKQADEWWRPGPSQASHFAKDLHAVPGHCIFTTDQLE